MGKDAISFFVEGEVPSVHVVVDGVVLWHLNGMNHGYEWTGEAASSFIHLGFLIGQMSEAAFCGDNDRVKEVLPWMERVIEHMPDCPQRDIWIEGVQCVKLALDSAPVEAYPNAWCWGRKPCAYGRGPESRWLVVRVNSSARPR